jgi:hypothetical protein
MLTMRRSFVHTVGLGLLLRVPGTQAERCNYDVAGWFPKPSTPQYAKWYSEKSPELLNISNGVCHESLRCYQAAFDAPPSSTLSHQLLHVCYHHQSCILSHLSADHLANYQSTNVILGLMPTLLATIGPSLAEISLVSSHRPVLSFLLSMSAPAVWQTRFFEYSDPLHVLRDDSTARPRGTLLRISIGDRWSWMASLLSIFQYLIAAGAVANIIATSIELGQKTILAWACTTTFAPLLWTTLASGVHIIAAAGFSYAQSSAQHQKQRLDCEDENQNVTTQHQSILARSKSDQSPKSKFGRIQDSLTLVWRHTLRRIKAETTLCARRAPSVCGIDAEVPPLAVLANVFAVGCGFAHIVFGIVVFSSLQFLTVWDAWNLVLWRYILSTFAGRLILMFEIAGLRSCTVVDSSPSKSSS